jgi:hypothetical protein
MISKKMREQFEAWASENGMAMHLARGDSGLYVSRVTQNYMDCWMASRAAFAEELKLHLSNRQPEPPNLPPHNCRQMLAASGQPYPRSSCASCGQFSPKWKECDAAIYSTTSVEADV